MVVALAAHSTDYGAAVTKLTLLEHGDDFPTEEVDRGHDLVVGDHVGLHDHEDLVGPAFLVGADAGRAAFGVARDDDSTLGERGRLQFLPDGACRIVVGLRCVPDEEIIELPLQVVGQAAPCF